MRPEITVSIEVAWWISWYLTGVSLTAWLTGMEPDMEKVGTWVARSIRVRVGGRSYRVRAQRKSEAL